MTGTPPAGPRSIEDGEIVTQYGFEDPRRRVVFPSHPRWGRETDLSMLLGRFSVEGAAPYVRVMSGKPNRGDAVRSTTAGALRTRGFTVRHSWRKRNPYHVSVEVQPPDTWDDHEFELAFEEPPADG